jgi:UDP-N-acetylglucosamine 1-carboxyvinyltransferase
MSKFVIKGGKSLKGAVRLGGAKNASFKLMIASLLAEGETRLLNFSRIGSVALTKQIIKALGGEIRSYGKRTLFIDAANLNDWRIPEEFGEKSRASTIFVGPLLARFGKAVMPVPGGDKIGSRPLDRHFAGLKELGAEIEYRDGAFYAHCDQLHGGKYRFDKNTHTGTETLIMAAVCAKGETVLRNAAQEPEIDDLIKFLNKMGAEINRDNKNKRKITIKGKKKLHPTIHSIMPDRNEAVTYACAALGTKGDIVVENAKEEHLQAFLEKVSQAGGGYEIGNYGVRFFYKEPLQATKIITHPHPGFMTDWQPLWGTLMTQAEGQSEIIEAVFLNRFQYAQKLKKMGADIEFFDPEVDDKEDFYNFNLEDDQTEFKHGMRINGKCSLNGIKTRVSNLRAGATLTLAALMSEEQSILTNISQIDRGYQDLDRRLMELGAEIKRV